MKYPTILRSFMYCNYTQIQRPILLFNHSYKVDFPNEIDYNLARKIQVMNGSESRFWFGMELFKR